ncbi:hypothetical protein SMA90_28375, partial [Escherichia coli]
LFSGETFEEGDRKSSADTSYAMQRIRFEKQEIIIELNNYAFQRRDGDRFGSDVMAQGLKSLGHRRDSLDSLYAISRTLFLRRLLVTGGLTYARQLDTANKQEFLGYFPVDRLGSAEESPQYADLINRAIGKVDQLSNQVDA